MAVVAVLLLLVASAVLGHVLMTQAPGAPLTVAVLLGPMATITALWLGRSGHRAMALGLMAALGAVVWATAEGRLKVEAIYVAQHAGIHVALAAWFGSTLRAGATPLIVQVARRVHTLTPTMAQYATAVTRAWVIYFLAMAGVSLLLFGLAPFSAWSVFANALTPIAAVAMFVGEHWLRYKLHPEFERVTMQVAVRAWRNGPK